MLRGNSNNRVRFQGLGGMKPGFIEAAWRGWRVLLFGLLFVVLPAAEGVAEDDSLARIQSLAAEGKFDQVLSTLRSNPLVTNSSPQYSSLVVVLERYREHQSEQAAKRKDAYEKARAQMGAAEKDGKLDEALLSLIEANGQSEDPGAMLLEPEITGLIQKADRTAEDCEDKSDWLEAINLYRFLDILHGEQSRYRARVKHCEQHLRVLRLYAPEEFRRLLNERAKRLGSEKPEITSLGTEKWEQQLSGIEMVMLRQALTHASRKHVGGVRYEQMLTGSLDALQIFVDTEPLAAAFASLGDAKKVDDFKMGIEQVRKQAAQLKEGLQYTEANKLLDRISAINSRTIALPEEVLAYEMTEGAMGMLDDYSSVIWPSEKEDFADNTQGSFSGIGVEITKQDGRLIAVSPIEDTPAQKAGIKPGDAIVAVDGRDTSDWSVDRAKREIRGADGTTVTLTIERAGVKEPYDVPIKRAKILIVSIKGWEHKPGGGWDYYIDSNDKIGYIRMSNFIPQTADDMDYAVNQMQKSEGLNGLVIDLRFNPGGLLSSAVDVSDRFIRSGEIVSTVGPNGEVTGEAKAKAHKTYPPFPVVVLVNEGSASASEIVSGCLQDHKRATIVGARSFGKGSVQDLFPIDGGKSYLKLTTQHYRLPNGRIIHRKVGSTTWGIEPDLTVKMTTQQVAEALEFRRGVDVLRSADDPPAASTQPAPTVGMIIEKGMDPQLETALLYLKTQLAAQYLAAAAANNQQGS